MGKQALHRTRGRSVQSIDGRRPLTTIVRRELIVVAQVLKFFLPLGSTRVHRYLGSSPSVKVPLNDTPRRREEGRRVDNDHLGHSFWEAQGIDECLFFDDGQSSRSELRYRKVCQVENTHRFKLCESWAILFLGSESSAKVVYHEKPVKFENTIQCSDAIDSVNVQDTRFREEERDASFIES